MELQTQIDELKAKVAQLEALAAIQALLNGGNVKCGIITCDGWRVVDKDGKIRIVAMTDADGEANVLWADKNGKVRITARTLPDGEANVLWSDKNGKVRIAVSTDPDGYASVELSDKDKKMRITASTTADGIASVRWLDKDGKQRIRAATDADGTVVLPTGEWNDPNKKERKIRRSRAGRG